MLGGLAALIALRVFFVRQVLAAFLLFTFAFAIFALIAFVLYIMDRAGQWGMAWAAEYARSAGQNLHRAWNHAETFSKKLIHRPRSQPAR